MNETINKIESILKNSYSTKNYVNLIKELFFDINILSPNKFNKEYTNFSSHIEGYIHVANYETLDRKRIIILAVQLKNEKYVENARSTQRSYAKKLIENANADAAFIAFYTDGEKKWRLSFVRLDYEMKIEKGSLKTTEKLTPAKRYSYLVGEHEPCHTAISRFGNFITNSINASKKIILDDLEEAFSVEKVTEEFFKLYCEKFHQLCEVLDENEDFCIEAEQHNFTSAQFAKKLMGQIIFLYFLQKKGWLGVNIWAKTLSEKDYKNAYYARGSKSRKLLPMIYQLGENNEYYYSGLKEISNEDEAIIASCVKGNPWGSGPHNFMRRLFNFADTHNKNFFEDYLEPLFYEALSVNRGEHGYYSKLHCRIPFLSGGLFEPLDGYDWEHNNFNISNEIFSNEKIKGREADGILDIFDRYNFTITEDEPMEREVAIDPEMLGKVFENLLEINDRKSKGAFYTPREIVHYMCQESLINYLVNTLQVEEEAIREFILYGDFMKDEDTIKEKRQGNGGMYISENLYKLDSNGNVIINRLKDMDEALKNIRIADPAVGSGAFPLGMLNEIVRARQNISAYMAITMDAYHTRLMYQMERSSYGLKYETIKNCIFAADIDPSAVDITQLRLWLSLVIDDEINPEAQTLIEGHKNPLPLPNLECNILCGNSLIDEFEGIRLIKDSDLFGNENYQIDINNARYESIIKMLIEKQNELFHCESIEKKKQLKNEIESLRDMIIMVQFEGCKPEQIRRYNESKNKASKPYILWQLDFIRIFREKGGFDIVIGNPPYGAKFSKKEKKVLSQIYDKSNVPDYESADFFVESGHRILKNNGILSYIIPNMFMANVFAEKYRKHLIESWFIKKIDNLSEIDIFESAKVRNCIVFFIKGEKWDTSNFTKLTIENLNIKLLKKKVVMLNLLIENIGNWLNLIEKDEIAIKIANKIENSSVLLGTVSNISQGLIPYDKYKGHSEEIIKNKIWNAKYKKDDTYKKELRGKDVNRYTLKWNGEDWISYGNWLAAPRKPEFFKCPRILVREITNPRILATYTKDEYYNTPSIINCIDFKVDIYYILGILNSELISFYHNITSPKATKGLFPKILVNDMKKIPIRISDELLSIKLIEQVKSMLNNHHVDIDKNIDSIVYKIYEINEEEIEYIKKWFEKRKKKK